MLKVGAWCSPIEIESRCWRIPRCASRVVGRVDDNDLVKPAAYIILVNPAGENDHARELQQFCRATLAGFKYPRWFYSYARSQDRNRRSSASLRQLGSEQDVQRTTCNSRPRLT
jgi:hypothetical protein